MRVATCDPREQLHKFVHGNFFLFASESGFDDAMSPPRISKVATPTTAKAKNDRMELKNGKTTQKCSAAQPSSGKGKKHKFNIKPRFS